MDDEIEEMAPGYLPIAPLEAIARAKSDLAGDTWTVEAFADAVGVSSRAVARWKAAGGRVLWSVADGCAIHLGLHPMSVWGDEWLKPDVGIMNGTDREGLAQVRSALKVVGIVMSAGSEDADIDAEVAKIAEVAEVA